MKKQQQKRVSNERKSILIKEKNESVQPVKSFLSIRDLYRTTILSNIVQILGYSLIGLSHYLDPEKSASENIPFLGGNAGLTIFLIGMLTLALATFVFHFDSKRKFKKRLRAYCLFTSVSAAESLETGDKIKGGFFAEKLFEIFPMFARYTQVKIGPWKTNLAKIIKHDTEEVYSSRREIVYAIMEKESETLSDVFYLLAEQLFSKEIPNNYSAGQESLRKIVETTKGYRRKKLTFFDKHPYLKNTLEVISEYVKLTIVLILSFLLWLTFGYGK